MAGLTRTRQTRRVCGVRWPRVRGGEGSRGSVLLDVLAALFIASTALLLLLGGVALAARAARRTGERAERLITERNEHALQRKTVFIRLLPRE